MENLITFLKEYFYYLEFPKVGISDIIEIIFISFLIYQIIRWIKNTRAWMLVKGMIILLGFTLVAMVFKLNTLLWIISNTVNVGIIAIIIIFQPELRRALEQLGRNKLFSNFFSFDEQKQEDRFSEHTISEVISATFELAKNKTGALIVMKKDVGLSEYERTGIDIDAIISSQLLINIFEHNTPLHDGAVIIRDNRIVSATCYLPLTDSLEIGKELGTRHRAGIGISEVSDSVTIIVSEETGKVSLAISGKLYRNVDGERIRKSLTQVQSSSIDVKRKIKVVLNKKKGGRKRNEGENIK